MEMYVNVNVSTCIHRAKPVTSPTVWLPLQWLLAHCAGDWHDPIDKWPQFISAAHFAVPHVSWKCETGAEAEARAHPFPIHPLAPGGKRGLLKP